MKITLQLLLVIVLSVLKLNAQTNFSIRGDLFSGTQGKAQLIINNPYLSIIAENIEVPITDGHFEIKTKLVRNFTATLKYGDSQLQLYIEPGFDLLIKKSENEKGTTTELTGKGANENKFYEKFSTQFEAYFNDSLNKIRMLNTTIDGYEDYLFTSRKEQMGFVNNDEGRKNYSADFNSFIDNEINYHYWRDLYAFPIINANRDSKILTVNPIPDIMLENFQNVKVNNEPALVAASYRDFVRFFIIYSSSKTNGFKKFTDYSISAERKSTIAKEKLEGQIYLHWLSRFLIEECGRLSPFMVKKLETSLKEADKVNYYYNSVTKYCDEIEKSQVKSDQPQQTTPVQNDGSGAGLMNMKGKPVDLTSLKGKVIYIDFWASWCGPCRKMMPFSKQMHDQLTAKQKKEIEFLYISIDADTAAWKKAINDLGMEGVQFISPGNWNSKACRYFQIGSIPRYMIMNKAGEIVDFNAKRPADPAVLQELIKLSLE